jgi:uncharacterized phage protein gp47/JayE
MHGFKAKNFQEIKTDLESAFLKEIDPSLRFTPDTVAGVLTGIMANEIAKVWEALYDLYHAQDPMCAKGRYLDILCSLTGTTRKEAFPSYTKALVRLAGNMAISPRILTLTGFLKRFLRKSRYLNQS